MKDIDTYNFNSGQMPITIKVFQKDGEFVPTYEVSIATISKNTEVVLEKIRQELIKEVNLGMVDLTDPKKTDIVRDKFEETINILIKKYFPDVDEKSVGFLTSYLIQRSLGMGSIEILMDDNTLEEIAINGADDPVWVYHRKHGWLKTNIRLRDEDQIKHYSTMIGRRIGRQITILDPLMDANLNTGDRVNATLMPISSHGNTITLRKFASKPWTITDFINSNTISTDAAAVIWSAIQYEMSALVAGGTASGKTSMLNAVTNFFPPNQRVISIEDTREIQLPKFLHWVPMVTRLPNTEGKGAVTMLDLLVNSLRMRPDRIIVGEIRRKEEAEVLFEAIHTGHSVYATVHANNANETITRLTNKPIEIPKTMIPALSLVIVQYRNRRSGSRRTFQIAEITEDATPNVLKQYDLKKDKLLASSKSKVIFENLETYAGFSKAEIEKDLAEKEIVLKWLAKNNINTIDNVGLAMGNYYVDRENFLKAIKSGKKIDLEEKSAALLGVEKAMKVDERPVVPEDTKKNEKLAPAGKKSGMMKDAARNIEKISEMMKKESKHK